MHGSFNAPPTAAANPQAGAAAGLARAAQEQRRESMNKTTLRKIVPYSVVLVVAAALYAVAGQFDFAPHAGRLGPDVWPKAILVLMMITCIFEITKTLLCRQAADEIEGLLELVREESAETHAPDVPEEAAAVYLHLLLAGIGLTIGYVYLIDKLGFFLDTLAFMILFMVVGRYRKPGAVIAIGLLGSLSFMFVFMKIVYVSLPIGWAPFSLVSLALMQFMGIK